MKAFNFHDFPLSLPLCEKQSKINKLLFLNIAPQKNLTFRAHTAREEAEKNSENHSQKSFKMGKSTLHFLPIFISLVFLQPHFSICDSILDLRSLKNTEINVLGNGVCNKRIGECLTDPLMESEISRRVLMMEKKYISYDTLKRDMVPCTKPGVSYYECHAGPANSYDRGCEVITRCARDVHDINT